MTNASNRPMPSYPELRPSGIHRAVEERRRNSETATAILAVLVGVIVSAGLWFVFASR